MAKPAGIAVRSLASCRRVNFFRSESTRQIESIAAQGHSADVFLGNWKVLASAPAISCDWGGPCIPAARYWETMYGWFHGVFPPQVGFHFDQRIWSVADSFAEGEMPCGARTQVSLDGNLGEIIPFGGMDDFLGCEKLVLPPQLQ